MTDIWHTKEKPMMCRDIILCGDGWSMAIDIIPETVNNICWENVEKWCYLDDLLALETELERTRKALGLALDWLEQVATPEKCDDDLCREFTKRKLAKIETARTKG